MIDQHEIDVTHTGNGFVLGEFREARHKDLTHIERTAQVGLFNGLDTMLDFVEREMPKAQRGEASIRGDDDGDGDDDFNAFNSYDEALSTFRRHPEKVVKFNPAELRIKDESEAGQQVDYDVVGDYIDMGRYMEGIPEAWGSMHNGNARNRRVNIMIALDQWWGIDHRDITHRGERILRLVDALEAGGVRTQVTGIKSNDCGHYEVILKRHDEPLTIADLAVVSHPEFLRRIIFRLNEYSKTWDYGYGSARALSECLNRRPEMLHSDSNNEMNIMVGSNMSNIERIDKTFDQMEKLLVWEMSKPIPEVDSIMVSERGIHFSPNGFRDEAEVQREGKEAINA